MGPRAGDRRKLNRETKQASSPRSALDRDFASHQARQPVTNRQTQPGSLEHATAVVQLAKGKENLFQLVRFYSDAGVLDLESQPARAAGPEVPIELAA